MSEKQTDHARGCQGREYTCTCGYDDQREWQPIETAPKDGTPILAFGPEPVIDPTFTIRETRWEFYGQCSIAHAEFQAGRGPSGKWGWHEPIHNWGCSWRPTHWMPSPSPPKPLPTPSIQVAE